MQEKIERLMARCKCGVHLTVNEHRDYYETAEQRLEWYEGLECQPEIDGDVRAGILRSNTIIDLIVYPDTPIGSYHIVHYSLDGALDAALACVNA